MSYLGLDIGTSGCKAVVFNAEGEELSQAHREYATLMPEDGWAELDSKAVMAACREVLAEAAMPWLDRDPVEGLGVSSQGEAFTAVDTDGEALNNAMVSFDTRAAELSVTWSEAFGRERLYDLTGHTAHPMFTIFKLLWIKENQPDVWRKAAAFYCFEDLLHHELGVAPAISYPLAGRTMMFNVRRHAWDEAILHAIELAPEKLARPMPSGRIVGTIPDDTCAELGLASGAIVATGGHDQPCGALGAGVLQSGDAVYGMGTTECITPAFEEPVFSQELCASNLCTYDHAVDGMYTTVAFSLTGGNLLRWYRDQWGQLAAEEAKQSGRDVYAMLLESLPTEPTDLLVLPHFTPTGTPAFDTNPLSAIFGAKLSTTRQEVLKALLEGVTMEMKLNVQIMEDAGIAIDLFTATGGGARSSVMVQLKADVLNRPIRTVEVTEAGCLGVAMLARHALTNKPLGDIADRWVRPVELVEPDPVRAARYAEMFAAYRRLYPALQELRQAVGV